MESKRRGSAAAEARKRVAAVRDDPDGRLQLASEVYIHPHSAEHTEYGRAELAFLHWEIERGVLAPLNSAQPGSPWWRAVNEELLRDALEAYLLASMRRRPKPSTAAAAQWLSFYDAPSAERWYRAHNASVANGYVRSNKLAHGECEREHVLMQLTLARVLYAHALIADEPLTGLDHIDRLGAWLVDPRRSGIGDVMNIDALYPRHYPLTDNDEDTHRSILDRIEEALTDLADSLILRALSRLFSWSSVQLGVPELGMFIDAERVVYPVVAFA